MSKIQNSYKWQGRHDAEGTEKSRRWHQVINQQAKTGDVALVGFCCDLGVKANQGRLGANLGPDALRAALANLAWHGQQSVNDLGNILQGKTLDEAQTDYAKAICNALGSHQLVIGLGGGHEIAWGSFQGLERYIESKQSSSQSITQSKPQRRIGIINFDAHFDLRKPAPLASSGTPFYQIAMHCEQHQQPFNYACLGVSESANTQLLFERATQLGVTYLRDEQCQLNSAKYLLTPMLEDIDELYVTVCLDAFPAAIAPGVSAPAALGIDVQFVIDMLRWLHQQQHVYQYAWRMFDIAELNPEFDLDKRTARLAARLVYEVVRCSDNGR